MTPDITVRLNVEIDDTEYEIIYRDVGDKILRLDKRLQEIFLAHVRTEQDNN